MHIEEGQQVSEEVVGVLKVVLVFLQKVLKVQEGTWILRRFLRSLRRLKRY